MALPDIDALLADPRWLLHRLDRERGEAAFVETDRETLHQAAFIDGRTQLGSGPELRVPLGALANPVGLSRAAPLRAILHVAFCRSTLLARALDIPGETVVYREPQAMIDLSDWQLLQPHAAHLPAADALVRRKFSTQWAGAPAIVKPSNWAILGALRLYTGCPVVLIDMASDAWLLAVVRGGQPRIAYVLRLASLAVKARPELSEVAAAATDTSCPAMQRALRLALLLLHAQRAIFADLAQCASAVTLLTATDLEADLAGSARRAAQGLNLCLTQPTLAAQSTAAGGSHAKADSGWSASDEQARGDAVLAVHGPDIEAALAWAAAMPVIPQMRNML